MQRHFNPTEQTFAQQVEQFVTTHWGAGEGPWRTALVDAGWSVPNWPEAHGGPGWSATRKFIWARCCARHGAPALADSGVTVVGPLLIGGSMVGGWAPQMLEQIRALHSRWCIAWAEPVAGADLAATQTIASRTADGWLVSGSKTWVRDAAAATHLLCTARVDAQDDQLWGLFALDRDAPGLELSLQTSWDGSDTFADIELDQVAARRIAGFARVGDLLTAVAPAAGVWDAYGSIAEAQVKALQGFLQETLSTAADEDLQRTLQQLQVQLRALQGLELRYVDAQQRQQPEPFPGSVLRLRGQQLLLDIGEAQVSALGYYALPFPDEVLLHNEGGIGPVGATQTLRHTLARQISTQYENTLYGSDRLEGLKDQIASALNEQ